MSSLFRFVNARRRIGWTTLCREYFSNCGADMVDAAYRAVVEEDPQRTLSPELRHHFVAMRVAAEGLYSLTLTRSALAGDLDAIVKGYDGGRSEICRGRDTQPDGQSRSNEGAGNRSTERISRNRNREFAGGSRFTSLS